MKAAVALVILGSVAAEWVGSPELTHDTFSLYQIPQSDLTVDAHYGFKFTVLDNITVTNVGAYLGVDSTCLTLGFDFYNMDTDTFVGSVLMFGGTEVALSQSSPFFVSVPELVAGVEYGFFVMASSFWYPGVTTCENAIYETERRRSHRKFDARRGRKWDRYDPAVDIGDSGVYDPVTGEFERKHTPANYFILFEYE